MPASASPSAPPVFPPPLVVDSGVVLKWVVPEHDSADALLVRAAATAGAVRLIAPEFLLVELGNILWKKVRRNALSKPRAATLLKNAANWPIGYEPVRPLLADALDLAVTWDRTVYDSLYLALSERESCPFVTADAKLVNAVAPTLAGPVTLADWAAANPPPPSPTP